MGLILDTSVLIAAERDKFDLLALFRANAGEEFFIASITASELLHGVERANTAERRQKRSRYVEGVLQRFPVIEFDLAVARRHAGVWAELECSGKIIGPHDMLIAATAIAHGTCPRHLEPSRICACQCSAVGGSQAVHAFIERRAKRDGIE